MGGWLLSTILTFRNFGFKLLFFVVVVGFVKVLVTKFHIVN